MIPFSILAFVGSVDTVRHELATFIESTQPDELMITAHIHDQAARLRSIEIIAEVRDDLGASEGGRKISGKAAAKLGVQSA